MPFCGVGEPLSYNHIGPLILLVFERSSSNFCLPVAPIFERAGAVKVTTLLDLAGLVIVLAAVAVTAGLYFIPAGLAVFGLGLLGISWLLDARKGQRK